MLAADIDSPTGGLQAQSMRLLRELQSRGIETSACTRNYHHLARNEVRDGIRIHRSPTLRRSFRVANSAAYLADSVAWLRRHRAAYEVIHCQQMFGPATAALLAKPLVAKPIVVRVSSTGDVGELADLRRIAFTKTRIRMLQRVDHWIALTRLMRSEIMSLGIPEERISVIANSAALPAESAADSATRLRYRQRLGLSYERMVVYSGRLSREKNLDTLLDAWVEIRRRIPGAHLLLLGAGGAFRNVEATLRTRQAGLGLESSVHFIGHVSNVGEYLLASDAFVLPTSTEGMSNALLEAMAAGCAIVTTNIEANREVVEDGREALLVEPRNHDALSSAVINVLTDSALAELLGRAARETAARNHAPSRMTESYLRVYQRLAASQR